MDRTEDQPLVGALAKMPTYGDFVRHQAYSPSWQSFDEWVQRGLSAASQRQGTAFKERYAKAPALCFMHGIKSTVLLGVMQPSVDAVGRAYPIILGVDIPLSEGEAERLETLPLQWASFQQEAARLAEEAASGALEREDFLDRIKAIDTTADARARAEWERYMHRTTIMALGRPEEDGEQSEWRLLSGLYAAVSPYRQQASSTIHLGLHIPLNGSQKHVYRVAFWLAALVRTGDLHLDAATVFWSVPGVSGSAVLFVFLKVPAGHAFPHLVAPGASDDHVLYLEEFVDGGASQDGTFPEHVLQNNARTLHQMLENL